MKVGDLVRFGDEFKYHHWYTSQAGILVRFKGSTNGVLVHFPSGELYLNRECLEVISESR